MKYTKLLLMLLITVSVFGFSFVGSAIDGNVTQLVAKSEGGANEAKEEKAEEDAEVDENSREAEIAKEREQTEAK